MLCGKEYVVQKDIIGMLHSYDTVIKVLSVMEKDGLVLREDNRRGGMGDQVLSYAPRKADRRRVSDSLFENP